MAANLVKAGHEVIVFDGERVFVGGEVDKSFGWAPEKGDNTIFSNGDKA